MSKQKATTPGNAVTIMDPQVTATLQRSMNELFARVEFFESFRAQGLSTDTMHRINSLAALGAASPMQVIDRAVEGLWRITRGGN